MSATGTKRTLIKGTIIYTVSGISLRFLGFLFRILISQNLLSTELGMYQLILSVLSLIEAFVVGGVITAISRNASIYASSNRQSMALTNLLGTMGSALLISMIICLIANLFPKEIGILLHLDKTYHFVIRICGLILPLSCFHAYTMAYYVGLEKPLTVAVSQFIEQAVRIGALFFLKNRLNAGTVFLCTFIGELAAGVFMAVLLFKEPFEKVPLKTYFFEAAKNIRFSIPLSANRLTLHFLNAVEAFLIPMMLLVYGFGQEDALAEYGIISGMVLPLIMFPATLSGAVSQTLLPSLSKASKSDDNSTFFSALDFAVYINFCLGVLCIPGFIAYGGDFGALIFGNERVYHYSCLLALSCPFIFLSRTFTSVLTSIEKAGSVFIINSISHLAVLVFIVAGVPHHGIEAYCIGFIVAHILSAVIFWWMVKKETDYHPNIRKLFLLPTLKIIICFVISYGIYLRVCRWTDNMYVCLITGGTCYMSLVFINLGMNRLIH